jgi:hypothetical protein
VAGGNLALSAAYGEVTIAAVGTATSVCDDRVVGFGHPATFQGKLAAGLHPAEALYVQDDPVDGPFKVANLGAPVGTITDDRQTGVTGTFGAPPPTTPISSTVTYGTRTRAGTSYAVLQDYLPDTAYYQIIGNHDRVLDAHQPGSEEQSWVITGTGPGGVPFTLDLTDRFVSSFDIASAVTYEVADMVWLLGDLPSVDLTGVTVEGTVSDDDTTWSVASVRYRSGKAWVDVKPRATVRAVPGHPLKLRAVLVGDGVTRTLPLTVDIPRKLAGSRGTLTLEGGAEHFSDFWEAGSLKQFLKAARSDVRNDAVVASISADTGRRPYTDTVESAPTDKVVQGGKWFRLVVAR